MLNFHTRSNNFNSKFITGVQHLQVSDKLKQAVVNLPRGVGQNLWLISLLAPFVSCVSAVRSPYTVSCSVVKRLHSLHLCCWLYCGLRLIRTDFKIFCNISEWSLYPGIFTTYIRFNVSIIMLSTRVRLQTL